MFTRSHVLTALAFVTLFTPVGGVVAQTPLDPSGHWEGSITAPFGEIPIALDIARRDGTLVATFSRQDGSISGFPLSDVAMNGGELKMTLKANGGGTMRASITGTQMTGTFAAFAGTAPFAVNRTGEPRLAAPLVNKAISKSLEGTWTTRLAAGADSTTLRMTLMNQPNGTATGTIADDHGVEVPVKFEQDGAHVTLEVPAAHSTFTGTLNEDGTAIDGSYVEGPLKTPMTFVRTR
jgi:hypothetical protein